MNKVNTYIIPVLNNYRGLLRLLETLEKYTDQNYKVIVINNGSSISDLEHDKVVNHDNGEVDRRYADPDLKNKIEEAKNTKIDLWIDPQRNLGFGKAMNLGLKLADTEFVTLANDDVEIIYRGWWEEIMAKFESEPDLGGFNPHSPCNKAADGNRYIQYEWKDEYTKEDIEKMKEVFSKEREYTGCCTYFTICKKAMFDDIGLFDESFGLGSGEDYDLCVRAARKGWKIKGGSQVMVWHWWGDTKDNMPQLDGVQQSNYELITGGNQNMERKWGRHIDKDPNGWSVSGSGGPEEPLDKDKVDYKNKKWFQEVEL